MNRKRDILNAALQCYLLAFIQRIVQTVVSGTTYMHNWHIQAIAWHLQQVYEGRIRRLLITVPPRHLKSLCASVAFPAWLLGRDPAIRIISASYANEFAGQIASQFRNVIQSLWYREAFPGLAIAQDTANDFKTTRNGQRYTTSVGGALTGMGADVIIIDDPMKSDDANSRTQLNKVKDWYQGSLLSRLNDKSRSATILIMQRLHVDDLAGNILRSEGQNWTHLNLPAIADVDTCIEIGPDEFHHRKAGELLHPARESATVLDEMKSAMGNRLFSAQYQQRPVPEQGNLIQWQWIKTYDRLPAFSPGGETVQSWDTAYKEGTDNDYSVCTTWLIKDKQYYLVDVFRKRLSYPDLKREVKRRAAHYHATVILIEDTVSGQALIADLRDERAGLRPIAVRPKGDKVERMSTAS